MEALVVGVAGACAAGLIVLAAAEGLENGRRRSSRGERGHRGQVASALCGGASTAVRRTPVGAPRQIGDDAIAEAVRLTWKRRQGRTLEPSLDGAGERHAPSTIHRIWRARLAPHRRRPSSMSDPFFVEGPRHRRSVFGAAGRALVLCVDESQIQALDSFGPSCRCAPGGGAAQPRLQAPRHDSLFAALDIATIIGKCFAPSGPRVPIPRRRGGPWWSTSTSSWTTTGPTKAPPDGRLAGPFHPPAPGSTRKVLPDAIRRGTIA